MTTYIHFTSFEDAKAICLSKELWESSFVGGVYAVNTTTGTYLPGVQLTELGRTKTRDYAVVFTTDVAPSYEYPEESVWNLDKLPIKQVKIISAASAISTLN